MTATATHTSERRYIESTSFEPHPRPSREPPRATRPFCDAERDVALVRSCSCGRRESSGCVREARVQAFKQPFEPTTLPSSSRREAVMASVEVEVAWEMAIVVTAASAVSEQVA